MDGLDPDRVAAVVATALEGPGGVALTLNVFTGVPGVVRTPAKRGMFRSEPERILIGDWRYEVAPDGRLHACHIINGIVIAEETPVAAAAGGHLARALAQVVSRYGAPTVPAVQAALEALAASSGGP
jgi:hypothetical protein